MQIRRNLSLTMNIPKFLEYLRNYFVRNYVMNTMLNNSDLIIIAPIISTNINIPWFSI